MCLFTAYWHGYRFSAGFEEEEINPELFAFLSVKGVSPNGICICRYELYVQAVIIQLFLFVNCGYKGIIHVVFATEFKQAF